MGTMAPKSKALPAGAVLLARWRGRNKLSQVEASKILSLDTGTYSSIYVASALLVTRYKMKFSK